LIDILSLQITTNYQLFQALPLVLKILGLGLAPQTGIKKACPARVAEAGQENIRTVHEPKPIQTADSPEDKVAVLWGASTAHKPGSLKGLMPSR